MAELFHHDVLAALRGASVRHVIVGGMAANLQGVPRFTSDLDVAVAIEDGSIGRAAEVLRGLGLACRLPVTHAELNHPETVRSWIAERDFQAITFVDPKEPLREVALVIASPVPFGEIERMADRMSAGGVELAVASIETLIRMKTGTGRKQDASLGFEHHHSDEELRAYARLTAEQKMRWLHDAWRFTADFLPASRREAWMKMRKGEA